LGYQNTNGDVSLGPLDYLFITPPFHGIPQLLTDIAIDRNFGNILSCLGYIFGSAIDSSPNLNSSEKGFEFESNQVAR